MRVFDILLALIALTGCTATVAVPVSMPVLAIIGIFFIFRVSLRQVWRKMTIICLLQLIAISIWGISAWIVDGYPTAGDRLFWGAISFSIIVAFTLFLPRHYLSSRSVRAWTIFLQLVMAVVMTGLTISTVFVQ